MTKHFFLILTTVATVISCAFAENTHQEFSSSLAKSDFLSSGNLTQASSPNELVQRIINSDNIQMARSSGCSVGCSTGCSMTCSMRCSMRCH